MKKNLLVVCGLFLLTLAACNENNITPNDAVIASSARGTTDSTKKNTTNVAVTQANLLPAISTYLTANYAGYTFVNAYSEAVNGVINAYDVNITLNSVPYHVVFSATGVFVSVNSNGKGRGKMNQSIATVAQADLLATIKTYLNTTYAGYTFINAYSETSNSVLTGYDVNITYNAVNYHVTFDATGAFVSVGTRKVKTATTNVPVAQADLLGAISTYLTTNYAGYTFVNSYSEAVNGVIANYDVNIISNAVTYHVVFDAKGIFVSVGTKGTGKKKGH
jgi:hypothetical protein